MKFAICSEIFQDWNDWDRTIEYVKSVGYDALEIAPFMLSKYITDVPPDTAPRIRAKAEDTGLEIAGLHWILSKCDGLHINSPDAEVRLKTADYLCELTRFCAALGGKVMIFGSPQQRGVAEGLTYQQAFDYTVEGLKHAAPVLDEHGIMLCMEPLSTAETNFLHNAQQTLDLVKAVDHPQVQMMLDTKAMTTEDLDRPDLIRKYAPHMKHYHANDANLNGPGFGEVDFVPIFKALKDVNFDGYVSVEVFKFEPGPEAIAEQSLAYMRDCLAQA